MERGRKDTELDGGEEVTLFAAHFASVSEADGVLYAGIADAQFDTMTEYLLLQLSLSPTNQDRELGHDCEHITINDQSRSRYGGIERVSLDTDRLILWFTEKAAKQLGVASPCQIHLNPAEVEGFVDFERGLKRILGDRFEMA